MTSQRSDPRDYRDDGPVVGLLARLDLPFPRQAHAVAVVLLAAIALMAAGAGGWHPAALLVPVAAVVLTGPSASRPLGGRNDWLVPPGLRAIEYGYLAAMGLAQGVAAPLVYVLLAVLAYHHYDIVYRTHQGFRPPDSLFRAGLGWDGRMLVVALAGLAGLVPFAYEALAVYLGVLFVGESVPAWTRIALMGGRGAGHDGVRGGVTCHLKEEEA